MRKFYVPTHQKVHTRRPLGRRCCTVVQLGNPSGAKLLPYKLDLPCVVLDSADAADRHLQSIEPDTVVGFDAEFRQEDKKQFLCIVQIATPSTVYIIDLIKIKACPTQLRRIAEDESILKCGVGISNDGKAFWDTFHINARGLADLGWMAKLAFPMSYRAKVGHVSLQQCVADMLHFNMGKEEQRSDWGQGLPDVETPRGLALITYAAIDAQAGLRLYPLLDAAIQVTSQQRKIEIRKTGTRSIVGRVSRCEWSCRWTGKGRRGPTLSVRGTKGVQERL
ncbi:ribonuclease H-like domain-containing protein [Favolaschia claudopus]|uniref:3'-5' exonuclease n=1 Tax=Favolaschia claudopus TaxID=2862362 RepID=A0AAV9Z7X7_9AGAR